MAEDRSDEFSEQGSQEDCASDDLPSKGVLPTGVGPMLQFIGNSIALIMLLALALFPFAAIMGKSPTRDEGQYAGLFLLILPIGLLISAAGEVLIYLRILAQQALAK